MMRSLYSGVSGLKNHQTRMDVVGNNISNVNTTGFKSSRVTFADTLSQTLSGASSAADGKGGTNPQQIGLGSAVSAIDTLFTNGSVQSTGVNTDLCLSGNGLFIVGKGDSDVYYTRNGNFKFDAEGNYVTSDGLFVKGWMANNGSLNTTSATTYIKIPAGKSMEAKATTQVTYTNNLDASEPMIESIIGKTYSVAQPTAIAATANMNLIITCDDGHDYEITSSSTPNSYNIGDPYTINPGPPPVTVNVQKIQESYLNATASTDNVLTIKLSDGTIQTVTDGSYAVDKSMPITTIVTIYDSLGNTHDVPLYFVKSDINSSTGNTWKLMVNQDGSGTVDIKGKDGKITTVDMPDVEIKFSTDGKFTSGNGTVTLTLNNGATGTQRVAVSLSGLTQYSGSNTAFGKNDGNAQGTLKSLSIDSSGVITGTYTNGINQAEAQVAIAQFNNAAGLTKEGNSLYKESNNSGTPNIKTANDLGCTITPSALEMSNVDMASELTDMIVTQRGYQSNSKIITVSDELLETLINMKR